MRDRVIAVILGVALLLTMAGCGNVEPSVSTSTPESTVTSGSTSMPVPTAADKATTAPTATSNPPAAPAPTATGEPILTPIPAAAESTSAPTATPTSSPVSTSAEKEVYLHDLKSLEAFSMLMETGSIEDFEDYPEFFQVLLDTLDMKTPEGQMLKADFESVFNLMERALGMVMTHPEEIDDEEYEQMNDELFELFELFEQHSEAFTDAAKKAGLTDSEIQQLNELLHD